MWVLSLGWEDPLEEGMATHSSVLAWKIPWSEEPGGIQFIGSQRAGHDWSELGFPCGWASKESACNVGDLGSIAGLRRSPGEGKGYPLQYSGLESTQYLHKSVSLFSFWIRWGQLKFPQNAPFPSLLIFFFWYYFLKQTNRLLTINAYLKFLNNYTTYNQLIFRFSSQFLLIYVPTNSSYMTQPLFF